MQLTPSLNIKQRQSLVMTPQLQQAIKLLQMTNLDLSKYLDEQTFENPFLETEDSNSNFQNDNLDDINKLKQNETNIKNEVDKTLETGSALSDDPTSNEDFDNDREYLINEDPFIFYNDAKKFILRTLNDYKDFKYITFKTHDAESFVDFQIIKDTKGNCYIDSPLIENEYL